MSARTAVVVAWLALLGAFHLLYGGFFPNDAGRVGHDFAFFLPAYLDGYVWFAKNGVFAVPWFTPSFCAGVPLFADPQSGYYSIPQWLTFAIDPVVASYLTLLLFATVGYFGMYRLCRGVFELPPALSILAAGLYFLNGFLPHRLIVGEPSFHALPLVPWVAYLLMAPATDRLQSVAYAVLAGVAGVYAVHSGLNVLMIPAAVSIVAVLSLHGLRHPWRTHVVLRGGLALAVCLGAAANKIVAGAAYLGSVGRPVYTWPGMPDAVDVVRVAALALFAPSETTMGLALGRLTNAQWTVLPHEWAYQFSVAPLLAVLCTWLVRRPADVPASSAAPVQRTIAAVCLGVLVVIPLAFLYYTPGLNALYTRLPVIGQSAWPMRWLVLYLPLVPLAVALLLHRTLAGAPRVAPAVTAATLGATVVLNLVEPREYYRQQPYDPRPVLAAHARFADGEASGHSIRALGVFTNAAGQASLPLNRNDAFLHGVSSMLCYNPIFGYRLERFPADGLALGSVLHADRGRLNFKNPACYVYPDENGCRPGDHFRTDEIETLRAFVDYRPIRFAVSTRQTIANWASGISLLGTAVFLLVFALTRLSRMRRA